MTEAADDKKAPFGHEPPAVDTRVVLGVMAFIVIVVAVTVTGLHFIMHDAVMPRHAQVAARAGAIPPPPRLQPHPRVDLARLRAQKHDALESYAWTDTAHTYARIPIERAMALYLQHPQHPQQSRQGTAP